MPVLYQGRFRPLDAYLEESHGNLGYLLQQTFEAAFHQNNLYLQRLHELHNQDLPSKEIAVLLDLDFPLQKRLEQLGPDLKLLAWKSKEGMWCSIGGLALQAYDPRLNSVVPINNFTPYPDNAFAEIRRQYFYVLESLGNQNETSRRFSELSALLKAQYTLLAGTPYITAHGKALHYPTKNQLIAESLYYSYPLTKLVLALYGIALFLFLLSLYFTPPAVYWTGLSALSIAFVFHTVILGLRVYILGRPPVSNMYETVIYVPWISVAMSVLLQAYVNTRLLFISSSFFACALLLVTEWAHLDRQLENVQAVLDSQFWLTIHVLMIVGSYGLFALSALLAHAWILSKFLSNTPIRVEKLIEHTLYAGTALLIPGTLLGGVWAAESWGRFWDWDPKETWAFISSCIYLMGIHAFRFGHIGIFGLSLFAILGFQSISFTWYGVNYILGTGLHSYGFGSGGESIYFIFAGLEFAIIGAAGVFNILQSHRTIVPRK